MYKEIWYMRKVVLFIREGNNDIGIIVCLYRKNENKFLFFNIYKYKF